MVYPAKIPGFLLSYKQENHHWGIAAINSVAAEASNGLEKKLPCPYSQPSARK
jgi:hypothetical protein